MEVCREIHGVIKRGHMILFTWSLPPLGPNQRSIKDEAKSFIIACTLDIINFIMNVNHTIHLFSIKINTLGIIDL